MAHAAGAGVHAGSELAGYQVEALVGRGGMGVVYRAFDPRLKRRVALKLVAPELAEDPGFRQRFLHESELAASLDHPNVIPIYEAGEADEHLYLAMRYVEGSDLGELLEREKQLTPEQAIAILTQVAGALDAAHAQGLVHRDVKPGNVLLAGEHAYLSDFGLSKAATAAETPESGELLGTIDYIAPEQIEDGELDGRADVYALTCMLVRCLTGEVAYPRTRRIAVLFAHLQDPPPSVHERIPTLPAALDPVIAQGLAKEPADRYASCRELVADAAAQLGLPGDASAQAPITARRRRWTFAAIAAALAAAGALAAGLLLALDRPAPAPTGDAAAPAERPLTPLAPNSVGVIDPATNEIVAQVPVGRNPTSVALGEGAVWVLNADDRTISRIDPETKEVREFAAGTEPLDIAAGEGAVWVLNADDPDDAAPTRTVSRIDPDSEETLTIELPAGNRFELIRFPGEQLLLVGEGAVFAIGSDGSVARIDPRTNEVVATIDPGVWPGSIALENGALWVSEKVGNLIARVDLRTGEVVGTFEVGTNFVSGIAVGGGVLWATDPIAGTVWRIEPDGISETIDVGEGASAIAFGEASTWVVSPRQGLIRRVDPGTNSDVETIPVGSTPQAVAVGADAIWVAVAESTEDPAADVEGSATPLPESFCGELIYEGDAAGPQYLIVSDLPLRGYLAASSRSIEAAIELVLRKRAFQAGPYRVGYQSCDDSSAREAFDLNKCTANARAYAAKQHILGVVGPANSDCALNEIPIANRADLAMVSPQNSATWLTSDDKSDSPTSLDRLYPTGKRTYLRVMPNDRAQGAAHALLAAELGVESVYMLGDDDRLRVPFRRAARRVGVAIAGESIWDQDATSYTDLAETIARSGADMVFIAGFLQGAREGQLLRDLRARLGDDFPITTGDGWWAAGALEVAGDAAIGLLVSTHGTPNQELPAPGKALVGELASTLPDGVVPSVSAVYGAQAAELLLDAIARSNGTRASVVDQLFASRIVDGLIGDFRFDTNGDPTLQTVTFLRVVGEGGAPATDPLLEASVVDRVITIQPELIRE